ncbi:MAG: TRAP transporter large permease [Alphaproteobacteria bacterium]
MTGSEIALLAVFGSLLVLGMPFAFALGLSILVSTLIAQINPIVLVQQLMAGISIYTLLSIPCFIFAGDLMYTGGLSRRLVNVAMVLLGRLRGGAAMVAVLSATMFGAITGSANATTAAIGRATIPEMTRRGYSLEFSAALAAAYGPIGILIPPSIPMIIWGVVANVSITKLFIGGILPGFLLCLGLMGASYVHARRMKIPLEPGRFSWRELGAALYDGKWSLLAPVIILGGIYGGIFTPTEAGAIGVVYGLAVGFFYRELRLAELPAMILRSMKTTAMVLYVVGMSSAFSWLMGYNNLPDRLGNALLSISANPIVILLIVNLLLLVVGSLMDEMAAVIILATFLIHVGNILGVDPIQYGVMIVMNIAVGLSHPPMGYTVFTASAVSGANVDKMIRPLVPLIAVELVVLLAVAYVPGISTVLLKLM